MAAFLDFILVVFVRGLSFLACSLPYRATYFFLYILLRIILWIQPKHLRIGRTNIEIAFPDRSREEREAILKKHIRFLARLIADALRLSIVTKEWAQTYISFPNEHIYSQLKENTAKGVVVATGHLGSFELFAYVAGLLGHPLSFLVRNFPSPRMDQWWCKQREGSGNTVIKRKGGYKAMMKELRGRRSVAMLFDQNVTYGHAVFPKWFNLEAATTKAIGYAALKGKSPVVVSAMVYTGSGRHTILLEQCDISALLNDSALSRAGKLLRITQVVTDTFCDMVEQYPEQWFWLHRRWKTRPDNSRYPYPS